MQRLATYQQPIRRRMGLHFVIDRIGRNLFQGLRCLSASFRCAVVRAILLDKPCLADKPLVVEVLGPAGTGKPTLIRALTRDRQDILLDFPLSRLAKVPFLVRNTMFMLPTYLRHYRHSRWFTWRETRSMVYLKAGLRVLQRRASSNGPVTLLDHGPIYRLATLREFGPEVTASQRYAQWWGDLFDRWTAALDMIVWLDAPNDVLLSRIRARDRWHLVKYGHESDAYDFLTRYRTVMEHLIEKSVADHRVAVLRFDTSRQSVQQMADEVLAALDGVREI